MKSRKLTRGMTLLELLMALAIFALAGTAIMKAASEHMHNLGVLEQTTIAGLVANNRLAELHLETQWPPKNNQKGKSDMANRTWHWLQRWSKPKNQSMRAVTVEVRLDPSATAAITAITTYVGRPHG